jgi:prevent-host-death family protein
MQDGIKTVGAAQAKAHFSAILARVAFGGEQYVIERRGKPLAALVSMDDLEKLRQERAAPGRPRGALALVGAWGELGDAEIDALFEDILASRQRDVPRPVDLEV